jgi:hypothetical protein
VRYLTLKEFCLYMDTTESVVRELIEKDIIRARVYPYGTVLIEEPSTVKAEFYQCFLESVRDICEARRQYA